MLLTQKKKKQGRTRRGYLAVTKLNWSVVGELKLGIEAAAFMVGISPSFMMEQLLLWMVEQPTNLRPEEIQASIAEAKAKYLQVVGGTDR